MGSEPGPRVRPPARLRRLGRRRRCRVRRPAAGPGRRASAADRRPRLPGRSCRGRRQPGVDSEAVVGQRPGFERAAVEPNPDHVARVHNQHCAADHHAAARRPSRAAPAGQHPINPRGHPQCRPLGHHRRAEQPAATLARLTRALRSLRPPHRRLRHPHLRSRGLRNESGYGTAHNSTPPTRPNGPTPARYSAITDHRGVGCDPAWFTTAIRSTRVFQPSMGMRLLGDARCECPRFATTISGPAMRRFARP